MIRLLRLFVVTIVLCVLTVNGQSSSYDGGDYYNDQGGYDQSYEQDYAQDGLYHDFAARQDAKAAGAGGIAPAGGGWAKVAAGCCVGWVLGGTFHSGRVKKKLNAKFKDDQKKLYQQYYNDVYTLQQQNSELMAALEQYATVGGTRRS